MVNEKTIRLGFLIIVMGIMLKIFHIGGTFGNIIIMLSLVLTLVFVVIAIFEINNSGRITSKEKIIWTLALLLFNILSGLIYFLIARPRILGN